ncbi:ExbD/TolR family protein [Barnesiella viscericola]|uniref:Biopolymer transporter ExbD n=1 Tax=Barnesiella viscericola DSM 18177 TaxID=880074 RepID=W0EQ34_9BACT|nr:biopolymer transporter ExbD [Barnesiella viscericola]AHF12877.1 biopolymer transporter ExbD [Barnesiella viscericola DSM 18177]
MALKRRHKIEATFSMASMTDVIFLLLIFFMITSTIVFPNSIKVNLPQSNQQAAAKPLTRVLIDENMDYYISFGNEAPQAVTYDQLVQQLAETPQHDTERYVALYADETVPYREIVKVLNVANDNHLKMVLATKPVRNP